MTLNSRLLTLLAHSKLRLFWVVGILVGGTFPQAASACLGPPQIFFHGGSSELSELARETLEGVVAEYYRQPDDIANVRVVGHSDLTGSRSARFRIAGQRAAIARDFLASRGVPGSLFILQNAGDSQPEISTEEGIREPMNRRVEITIIRSPAALQRAAAAHAAALARGEPYLLC